MKTYARRVCLGGQKVLAGCLLLGFAMVGEWVGATPIVHWASDSRYTPPPADQVNLWGKRPKKEIELYSGLYNGLALMAEKRESSRYDAPILQAMFKKKSFNATIPSMYIDLTSGNRKNYFFPNESARQKQDLACLYAGPDLTLMWHKGTNSPIRTHLHNIWPYDMLAVFEPKPDMKPLITLPESLTDGLSEVDKTYATNLVAVVNENLLYIGEIPFYKPDLNLDVCYFAFVGQVIPEKYLLTGVLFDKVPEKWVDKTKAELQRRLGYPVYNVCDLEEGREWKSYAYVDLIVYNRQRVLKELQSVPKGKLRDDGGSPIASCRGMKVVPTLYYIQGSADFDRRHIIVADALRKIQYGRAQESLKTLFMGLKAEKQVQKDYPDRVKVLDAVLSQAAPYGRRWNALLQKAMDEKKFLFSLTNLNGRMEPIQMDECLEARTTWGHFTKRGRLPIIVKELEDQRRIRFPKPPRKQKQASKGDQ